MAGIEIISGGLKDEADDGVEIVSGGRFGRTSQRDAFLYSAADGATMGAGDEIAGGVEAARAALTGGNAGDAYRRRVAEARDRLRRARQDRPASSLAGGLVGAGATFLVPGVGGLAAGGKALQAASAGRGAAALGAQSLAGLRAGALFGGLYGAASGEDDVQSRVRSALQGAALGGAFGLVTPAVVQGGGRVLSGADDAVLGGAGKRVAGDVYQSVRDRLVAARDTGSRLAADTSGSARIPPTRPPGPPAPPPEPRANPDDVIARRVDALMGRSRQSVGDLEATLADAKAAPAGRVLADTMGPDTQAKVKALAAAPGQTSGRVREVAEARAKDLPVRLIDELNSGIGAKASPTQARRAIAEDFRATSREGYAPALAYDPPEEALAALKPVLERFPDRVITEAESIMADLAKTEGLNVAQMTGAQRLHLLKMSLDDALTAMDSKEGIKAATRGALRRLKGAFLEAIEGDPDKGVPAIIPGYRDARMKWGSLHDAEEAIDMGKKAFQRRPEEVADEMARLTPFQREHYRLSVADEAARKMMRASKEVGTSNAANALNSRELQDVLSVVFEDPAQAAKFLGRLNEGNRLMRNAGSWHSGSDTVEKASQLADEGLETLIDAGTEAVGHPISAVKKVAMGGVRAILGPQQERQRDALGKALLTAIDDGDEEAAAFLTQLIRNLRAREAKRMTRGMEAGREAAAGQNIAPDDPNGGDA